MRGYDRMCYVNYEDGRFYRAVSQISWTKIPLLHCIYAYISALDFEFEVSVLDVRHVYYICTLHSDNCNPVWSLDIDSC
jgi:hypothetical protein